MKDLAYYIAQLAKAIDAEYEAFATTEDVADQHRHIDRAEAFAEAMALLSA